MEQAILVHVRFTHSVHRDSWPEQEGEAELRELVRSSGLGILEETRVRKDRPVPAFLIGKGRIEELQQLCRRLQSDLVVFGQDLSSSQQRNLEELLDCKVIDRTQLILDIFAQRAHSQEGKVQVELAQLRYLLPRLVGKDTFLSRLGGGIGTRGPGEQKLEIDRRRIRLRISRLVQELSKIQGRRRVARGKRGKESVLTAALIGYTNAGKSTLLNTLTQAGAPTEDRLFTTLDPLTRRLSLPNGQPLLVTDTVGFLHRLPHHLIEAFRATLEEVSESALLLQVLDASDPLLEEKEAAVEEVLQSLGAQQKPRLTVLNKCDRLSEEERNRLSRTRPEGVQISALTGKGLNQLLDRLMTYLQQGTREIDLRLPRAEHSAWLDRVYRQGQVVSRNEEGDTLLVRARVPVSLYGQLKKAGLLSESA